MSPHEAIKPLAQGCRHILQGRITNTIEVSAFERMSPRVGCCLFLNDLDAMRRMLVCGCRF